MKRLSGKLTYANVISTLCLVLLLGGGTAYAASQLEKESVGARQLAKGAVTPVKLSKAAKATLTGPKGETGAAGANGQQGPKGEKGEKGDPGPIGPSDVFSAVHAGGLPVKAISEFGDETFLGLENLPAGSYLIQATLQGENLFESVFLTCSLVAGEASSEQLVAVGVGAGHSEESPLALQLTHKFTSTGTAELECGINGGSHTTVRNLTMTAIKVGNLTERSE